MLSKGLTVTRQITWSISTERGFPHRMSLRMSIYPSPCAEQVKYFAVVQGLF